MQWEKVKEREKKNLEKERFFAGFSGCVGYAVLCQAGQGAEVSSW